jgi:hypothetical protein
LWDSKNVQRRRGNRRGNRRDAGKHEEAGKKEE